MFFDKCKFPDFFPISADIPKNISIFAKLKNRYSQFTMSKKDKDITEYLVVFVAEFAKRFGLKLTQSFNYLNQYGAMLLLEEQYGYVHTQSFESIIDEVSDYCQRKGGNLR